MFWEESHAGADFDKELCYISTYETSWTGAEPSMADEEIDGFFSQYGANFIKAGAFAVGSGGIIPIVELEFETLSFYPNPTRDFLVIALPQDWTDQVLQLELYDMQGKQIWKEKIVAQNNIEINLSKLNLSSSNYILNALNAKGLTARGQFTYLKI